MVWFKFLKNTFTGKGLFHESGSIYDLVFCSLDMNPKEILCDMKKMK